MRLKRLSVQAGGTVKNVQIKQGALFQALRALEHAHSIDQNVQIKQGALFQALRALEHADSIDQRL